MSSRTGLIWISRFQFYDFYVSHNFKIWLGFSPKKLNSNRETHVLYQIRIWEWFTTYKSSIPVFWWKNTPECVKLEIWTISQWSIGPALGYYPIKIQIKMKTIYSKRPINNVFYFGMCKMPQERSKPSPRGAFWVWIQIRSIRLVID